MLKVNRSYALLAGFSVIGFVLGASKEPRAGAACPGEGCEKGCRMVVMDGKKRAPDVSNPCATYSGHVFSEEQAVYCWSSTPTLPGLPKKTGEKIMRINCDAIALPCSTNSVVEQGVDHTCDDPNQETDATVCAIKKK